MKYLLIIVFLILLIAYTEIMIFVGIAIVIIGIVIAITQKEKSSPNKNKTNNLPSQKTDYPYSYKQEYNNEYKTPSYYITQEDIEKKDFPSSLLYPKETISIVNNFFARKKIVFTGDLENYPYRKDIAKKLWELGADIDSNVSKNTNIVIVGNNPGSWKEDTIENLQSDYEIYEMDEFELLEIIEKIESKEIDTEINNAFRNSVFYFNGNFRYFYNSNLKLLVNDRGGTVSNTLTTSVHYFVIGDNCNSTLYQKAYQWELKGKYNIKIIDENQFIELLNI